MREITGRRGDGDGDGEKENGGNEVEDASTFHGGLPLQSTNENDPLNRGDGGGGESSLQ